jgi:ribosome biogenesis GTPase
MIVGVAERTSAIVRRDPSPGDNRDQVLAANLDSAFILCRLDRKVRMSVIERYMVLVWDSGSVPVIVLSKADLVPEADVASALRMVSRDAAGVTVVATSGVTGEGVGDLAPFLAEAQTVGLLGESGAGKSTLINQLFGSAILETGETRRGDGRGRHTTTARQMLPLGNGTVVIDTPGLRTVGLADSSDGISRVFADVEELAGYCKFRDCSHQAEPGCAILMAIEGGVLDARRFESYLKLEREQARLAQRKEAITRRAVRKEVARKRIKSAQRSRDL